ncbi:unnamed protein product, partial [Protopolystoma xenopodis]
MNSVLARFDKDIKPNKSDYQGGLIISNSENWFQTTERPLRQWYTGMDRAEEDGAASNGETNWVGCSRLAIKRGMLADTSGYQRRISGGEGSQTSPSIGFEAREKFVFAFYPDEWEKTMHKVESVKVDPQKMRLKIDYENRQGRDSGCHQDQYYIPNLDYRRLGGSDEGERRNDICAKSEKRRVDLSVVKRQVEMLNKNQIQRRVKEELSSANLSEIQHQGTLTFELSPKSVCVDTNGEKNNRIGGQQRMENPRICRDPMGRRRIFLPKSTDCVITKHEKIIQTNCLFKKTEGLAKSKLRESWRGKRGPTRSRIYAGGQAAIAETAADWLLGGQLFKNIRRQLRRKKTHVVGGNLPVTCMPTVRTLVPAETDSDRLFIAVVPPSLANVFYRSRPWPEKQKNEYKSQPKT